MSAFKHTYRQTDTYTHMHVYMQTHACLPVPAQKLYTHVYIYPILMPMKVCDGYKYFIVCSSISSFKSMTTELFLVWQTYLFLKMPKKLWVVFTNVLHYTVIFILLHLLSLRHSLFDSHICFANAYKVWSENHKYFTLVKNNCSFTNFLSTELFLVWQTYSFLLIYAKKIKLCTHIYLYTMLQHMKC